jgi:hypothetical protein
VQEVPGTARRFTVLREAIRLASAGDVEGVDAALTAEITAARRADREYWLPLRQEFEQMLRQQLRSREKK